MQLHIPMSHITLARIYSVYNKNLTSLITEDAAGAIKHHKITLLHLYDSSPKTVQELLERKYPQAVEYAVSKK